MLSGSWIAEKKTGLHESAMIESTFEKWQATLRVCWPSYIREVRRVRIPLGRCVPSRKSATKFATNFATKNLRYRELEIGEKRGVEEENIEKKEGVGEERKGEEKTRLTRWSSRRCTHSANITERKQRLWRTKENAGHFRVLRASGYLGKRDGERKKIFKTRHTSMNRHGRPRWNIPSSLHMIDALRNEVVFCSHEENFLSNGVIQKYRLVAWLPETRIARHFVLFCPEDCGVLMFEVLIIQKGIFRIFN